jgi:hypothetical protein
MTRAEVQAILGGPPERSVHYTQCCSRGQTPGFDTFLQWSGTGMGVAAYFDADSRVIQHSLYVSSNPSRTWLDRVKCWLGI